MKRKNGIALVLSLLLVGSCLLGSGCSFTTESSSTAKEPEVICDMLSQSTDYVVVIPADYTKTEEYSAKEICSYFELVSGKSMSYEVESSVVLTEESTYISLGDTALFRVAESCHGAVDLSESALNTDGFYIFTYGHSVFINAFNDRGIMYGAFEFIENTLGVKFLTNEYTHIPQSDSIELKEYDKAYAPLFRQRTYLNTAVDQDDYEYTAHMRYNTDYCKMPENMGGSTQWANLGPAHTSFSIVKPSDYATGESVEGKPGSIVIKDEYKGCFAHTGTGNNLATTYIDVGGLYEVLDLCYTSGVNEDGTMSDEDISTVRLAVESLKKLILEDEDAEYFMFGQQDRTYGCSCDKCKASKEKYSDSGLMIRFINCVSDQLDAWLKEEHIDRSVNLVIFAYAYNELAPVDSDGNALDPTVVPRDNVYIRYAPIHGIYYYALNDERQNEETLGIYENWGKLTDNLMVWTYHSWFAEYFWYYPTIHTMRDTLTLLRDVGTEYVFAQGAYDDENVYEQWIESYVFSKLCWDIDTDIEQLRNEFIYYYFGESASTYIEEFHDRVEDRYVYLSGDSQMYFLRGDFMSAEYWQYSFVNGLCDLFDEAISATESNAALTADRKQAYVSHLREAKLVPMYMRLKNARSYVEYTDSDVVTLAQEWITLAEEFGVSRYGEGTVRSLSVLKAEYNLN